MPCAAQKGNVPWDTEEHGVVDRVTGWMDYAETWTWASQTGQLPQREGRVRLGPDVCHQVNRRVLIMAGVDVGRALSCDVIITHGKTFFYFITGFRPGKTYMGLK